MESEDPGVGFKGPRVGLSAPGVGGLVGPIPGMGFISVVVVFLYSTTTLVGLPIPGMGLRDPEVGLGDP